jgi:alpha-1,2-mannosyltransferase
VLAVAPWLLALSLAGHFLLTALDDVQSVVDLRVYVYGAPHLLSGDLYDFTYDEFTPDFPLPFTYPPFAALVFLPLSVLPWIVARWLWQALSVACLFWIVRVSLRLIRRDTGADGDADEVWRRRAMLWTALTLWIEPVRTTLNYGQINLVLIAVLLAAMASSRSWLAGLGVGAGAGVKLTPAISGVHFLLQRRWAAAAWSFAGFLLTVGLAWLIAPAESFRYWFELLGDADRIGPVGSAINQSLRGSLTRTVHFDVETGPIFLAAAAVATALFLWAAREAVRAGDGFAALVSVQVYGLLVSPISWSHHWVWAVPVLLWLLYGRARGQRIVVATAIVWVLAVGSYLISFLITAQQGDIWKIERAWYLSALGWVYPLCGLLTLVAVAVSLRGRVREPEPVG